MINIVLDGAVTHFTLNADIGVMAIAVLLGTAGAKGFGGLKEISHDVKKDCFVGDLLAELNEYVRANNHDVLANQLHCKTSYIEVDESATTYLVKKDGSIEITQGEV